MFVPNKCMVVEVPIYPITDTDPRLGPDMSIVAHFAMNGISGHICFYQAEPGAPVTITVKLNGLDQIYPQSFDWMIANYPIQYVNYPDFPCSDDKLGDIYRPVECPYPFNTSTCVYGNLGERLGAITSTTTTQTFEDGVLDLYGPNSPIGRSIVLKRQNNNRIPFACANINYQGISLTTLRAGFNDLVNGDVILRRANGRSGMTLNVDLFTACNDTGVANDDGSPLNWNLRSGSCNNPGPVSKYMYMLEVLWLLCIVYVIRAQPTELPR